MAIDPEAAGADGFVAHEDWSYAILLGTAADSLLNFVAMNEEHSFDFSNDNTSNEVPHATDPNKPNKKITTIVSKDLKVSGGGVCDPASYKFLLDWWENGGTRFFEFTLFGKKHTGQFTLDNFNPSNQQKGIYKITVSLTLSGDMTIADAA